MSKETKGGGGAFPTLLTGKWAGTGEGARFAPDMTDGMSLRDWFAGMALQGMLAADAGMMEGQVAWHTSGNRSLLTKRCYMVADEMIKARGVV